ncbi:hypothetical protein SAY86_000602 [Trapa natans]|uniref:Uncharacterized protein n=1 Tax=Trapa natans TaxID=22666 RepID=A0AAN7RE16_TRANT|nr:hypothetical protein SAY86_000602 [Trapa natans]
MEVAVSCPASSHQQWVLLLTGFGPGHLFPSLELCRHIASRNYKTTLIVFSHLYSSIIPSFTQNPLIDVVQVPSPSPRPGIPVRLQQDTYDQLNRVLKDILSGGSVKPVCAVVNMFILMNWTKEIFKNYQVPVVGFFTSGACSPAMEYASWKAGTEGLVPDKLRPLPGLPDEMGLTTVNIKRRPSRAQFMGNGLAIPSVHTSASQNLGPPGPGKRPDWMDDVHEDNLVGLFFNTFDYLEGPFLEYLASQLKRPAWGVGPLLPDCYWEVETPLVGDREVRVNTNKSSVADQVNIVDWLDTKLVRSVLFISFGSSLSPTDEEQAELAEALAESAWPFIWVVQPGANYFPHGLEERVSHRGLVIAGWAPQLLILSHRSTAGFLSHWGDQYDNAKLVVDYLKVDYRITEDPSSYANKSDFLNAMERLMGDTGKVKDRADEVRSRFGSGFPSSSNAALDDFENSIRS